MDGISTMSSLTFAEAKKIVRREKMRVAAEKQKLIRSYWKQRFLGAISLLLSSFVFISGADAGVAVIFVPTGLYLLLTKKHIN